MSHVYETSTKFDSPLSHSGTHIIIKLTGTGSNSPVARIAVGRQQALFEQLLPIVMKGTYQAVKYQVYGPDLRAGALSSEFTFEKLYGLGYLTRQQASQLQAVLTKKPVSFFSAEMLVERDDTPGEAMMGQYGWDAVRSVGNRRHFIADSGAVKYTHDNAAGTWELECPQGGRVWTDESQFIHDFTAAVA